MYLKTVVERCSRRLFFVNKLQYQLYSKNMNFKFLRERNIIDGLICLAFLTACHWIQFSQSSLIQAAIRGICTTIAFFVTLFTGRKYWNPLLFVWALAILYWNRFINYTSFIMILIAIWLNPKTKFPYLLTYSCGVLVSLFLYKDSFSHLIIHFFGCFFFYAIFSGMYHIVQYREKVIHFLHEENRRLRKENQELRKLKKNKLNLTPDEATIISELCAGKEIKELDYLWSQNTIYTRLREARERNGCINNEELKSRFNTEFPVDITN